MSIWLQAAPPVVLQYQPLHLSSPNLTHTVGQTRPFAKSLDMELSFEWGGIETKMSSLSVGRY